MKKRYNVAIVGATGIVGIEMLRTIEKRKFPIKNLRLLASRRSVGSKIVFRGNTYSVEELSADSLKGFDIVFFSAGASSAKEFSHIAVENGAVVIDNSSAFRMDSEVPLIVPEVNIEELKNHKGIISNPNCSTIIMVVPVYPLHRVKRLKRVIASTYQAVSGWGAQAMVELEEQTKDVLAGKMVVPRAFPHRIAFNLFPHIDIFSHNAYTEEEMKMVNESRKIMRIPDLQASCTCVRVPVYRAHSESLLLEFENEVTPDEAREIISYAPGTKIVDNIMEKLYPMPIDASGKDEVLVGRIRQDISRSDKRGLNIFISGDQLLKGAALNAIQIAEHIMT